MIVLLHGDGNQKIGENIASNLRNAFKGHVEVNIAYQTTIDGYDSAGNITNRVWKNPNGTTNRTQALSWDARGRLHSVNERDASNSGYNWTAIYDGLSRRLSTTSILVTNGVALTSQPTTINSYYDPQVEFLELGVSYGVTKEWKLYGPDPNCYTFAGGDPINGFDSDGRFTSQYYNSASGNQINLGGVNSVTSVTGYSGNSGIFGLNLQTDSGFNLYSGTTGNLFGGTSGTGTSGGFFETASTTLNIAGIAQFGAEYGSGGAVLGLFNSSATSSGLYFNSSFWGGNQYVDTWKVSDLAHGAGWGLFGANVLVEGYGVGTGQESPLGAVGVISAGYLGMAIPPLAGPAAAYGFFHTDVDEATEQTFQMFTDYHYGVNDYILDPPLPAANGNLFNGNNSSSQNGNNSSNH